MIGMVRGKGRWFASLMVTTALGGGLLIPAMAAGQEGAAPSGSGSTEAVEERRSFNIPAQSLAGALTQFGVQSGMQVSVRGDVVEGLDTSGVNGLMTPELALRRLLAGTGIVYEVTDGDTVTLTRVAAGRDEVTLLDPVRVEGEAGRQGAVRVGPADLARRAPADVQDVFAGEPAVSVGSSIPISQKIYVHGVEETNLAVSVDGARQNNKVFHHSGTNLIDPSLLKAVEIEPGVAPADAGPAAMGGSIRFETVDAADVLTPDEMIGGFVKSSYNSNGDTLTGNITTYGQYEGLELLGSFNRASGDEFKDGSGDTVVGSEAALTSALAKLAYEFDSGHPIEFAHERVRDDADRPYRANFQGLSGADDSRNYNMQRQNYVLTYSNTKPEGWLDPTLVLAYADTDLEVLDPFGSIGSTSSISGKLENRFPVPFGSVTAGLDFYKDHAEYVDPTAEYAERATNIGLFAQARLEPIDNAHLSFGMRGDRQWFRGTDGTKLMNNGVSGNVHAEYEAFDILTVHAGYSHVWGGISLAENFIQNPAWTYDDGIDPVQADNITVGLTARYEGFTVGGNVFRTQLYDVRDPDYTDGPGLTEDFLSKGFDVGLGYDWGDGFANVKYALTDISVDGEYPDSFTTQYLGAPLGEQIVIEAEHAFEEWGLTVGSLVQIALADDRPADAGNKPYEAYRVADFYVEYAPDFLPNVTTRLDLKNAFNETYADRATYGQEFDTVDPLYEPGRSVRMSVKVAF